MIEKCKYICTLIAAPYVRRNFVRGKMQKYCLDGNVANPIDVCSHQGDGLDT